MKQRMDPLRRSRLMYIIQAAVEYLTSILVHGAFLATLTAELGISDSLTGILSSFVSLGCLFQMLSIFFRRGNTKKFVLWCGIANQSLFLLFYLIPLMPGMNALRIVLFVLAVFFSNLIYNVAHPKKINWFMSLVSEEARGSFTANKEIISLLLGMGFNFAMGALIDHFRAIGDLRTGLILAAVTMAVLAGIHTITVLCTVEQSSESAQPEKNRLAGALSVFKDKTVLKITAVFVLWYAANHCTISFYSTYTIKELGFSLTTVSIITLISSGARILVSKFWGAYADRNSFAKMIVWCFLVTAVGFAATTFTVPANGIYLYPVYSICHAIGQGGINSALINLCYDYVPFSKRSDALAFSQAVAGLTGFLAALCASPLISHIQANGNRFLGIPVYAQQVTSAIAFLLMIVVILYVIFVVLPIKRDRGGLSTR